MGVFFKNLLNIEAVNNDPTLTYTAGLNKFSDLTEEEFVAKYTGLIQDDSRPGSALPHVNTGVKHAGVDWRARRVVTPVISQGQCGDSPYWGAVNALESAWSLAGNALVPLSVQQVTDCSRSFGISGCGGGYMSYTYDYLIKGSKGIMSAADYPYTATDGPCKFKPYQITATLRAYHEIDARDCDGLLNALGYRPVASAIAATYIASYQSGIYNDPRCGVNINHGVSLVGYGTEGHHDYWIVRNSWGSEWGELGYIRLAMSGASSEPGMCGVCLLNDYPVI